jgi:hypothetical protein
MATTYKVLGQSAPSTTSNADLLTVGSGKSVVVSSLVIANVTASAATCRVFVRIAGATAAASNSVAYDVSVPANTHMALTEGWTLAATDVVTVQTGTGNALTFTLFGSEIV